MASLTHCGFFVLRTPSLPVAAIKGNVSLDADWDLKDDGQALADLEALARADEQRIRSYCRDSLVNEALFLASPVLYRQAQSWIEGSIDTVERNVLLSLHRYLTRMATRATPFGLFAGCGVGDVGGDRSQLLSPPRTSWRRHIRLDGDIVRQIAAKVLNDENVRRGLRFFANPTLLRFPERIRYTRVEDQRDQIRAYLLTEVEATECVLQVLDASAQGIGYEQIVDIAKQDGASVEEAYSFANALIDHQLLVPCGIAVLTGKDPLASVIDTALPLAMEGSADVLNVLSTAKRHQERFDELENAGTFGIARCYEDLEASLLDVGITPAPSGSVFVDLKKKGPAGVLSDVMIDRIIAASEVLFKIGDTGANRALEDFVRRFDAKFGGEEVPLLQALDDDFGIPFGASAENSVAQIPPVEHLIRRRQEHTSTPAAVHDHLLRLFAHAIARGDGELSLSDEDIQAMLTEPQPELPPSFYAAASIISSGDASNPEHESLVVIHGVRAPSAVSILGRFAAGDDELTARLRQFTRAEEARFPDAIVAEIVHVPSGRVANVTSRPLIREFEIPYLAESGTTPEKQLQLKDLWLRLDGGRLVLFSKEHGKEVLPRIANAHFPFARTNTPLYCFLRELAAQGFPSRASWTWGGLASAPALPRVTYRGAILSPAQWNISYEEASAFRERTQLALVRAVRRLRSKYRMPRYVSLVEGDNYLVIDFENPSSIEAGAIIARRTKSLHLSEYLQPSEQCMVKGADGLYAHEFVVPVLTRQAVRHRLSARPTPTKWEHRKIFPPSSEWLFFKFYATPPAAEQLLLSSVIPVLRLVQDLEWFFIRYADPENHIRLRIRTGHGRLLLQLLRQVSEALSPACSSGLCERLVLDSYIPETARYGGEELLPYSEHLFFNDSTAVVTILEETAHDVTARWKAAVFSFVSLLRDFRFSHAEQLQLLRAGADATASGIRIPPSVLRNTISRWYRTDRALFERLVDDIDDSSALSESIRRAVATRASANLIAIENIASASKRLAHQPAGTARQLMFGLARSHLHMHVNRLFPDQHIFYENALFEFVRRAMMASEARKKGPAVSPQLRRAES